MTAQQQKPSSTKSLICEEMMCLKQAEWKVIWHEEGYEGLTYCCTEHVGENCHTDMETTVTPLHKT